MKTVGLRKAVVIKFDTDTTGKIGNILIYFKTHGQHKHIKIFLCDCAVFLNVANRYIIGSGHRIYGVNPGSDKSDAFLFGILIIFVKVFAVGAHIHIKHRTVQRFGAVLFGNDGLLNCVHTAHGRTIRVITPVEISGTDTLQPADLFGLLLIRRPDQMPHIRAGGRQNSFKLQSGQHIGQLGVAIAVKSAWIKGFKSRRKDDGPHVKLNNFILLRVIDGFNRAGLGTYFTSAGFKMNTNGSVNDRRIRNRLGIRHIDRPSERQPGIIF